MGPFIWIRIKLSQETDGCIAAKGKFNSSVLFVRADTRRKGRKLWTDSSPLSHCCAQMTSWAEGVLLRRFLLFRWCSWLDASLGTVGSAAAASSSAFLFMLLGTSIIFSKKPAGRHLMLPRVSS